MEKGEGEGEEGRNMEKGRRGGAGRGEEVGVPHHQ